MTSNSRKKDLEREYAEKAGGLLKRRWELRPHDKPDFVVTEAGHTFGLEVCSVHAGEIGKHGSSLRRCESLTQRAIDAIRQEYEASTSEPLRVYFVGSCSRDILKNVATLLIQAKLDQKPVGHEEMIQVDHHLKLYVMRSFVPIWFRANDTAGWVHKDPIARIEGTVRSKSRKLPCYIEEAGPDIRLLVVADRTLNSGKMVLLTPAAIPSHGFREIYFLSYPDAINVIAGDNMNDHR